MKRPRVLLADDHTLVLEGIKKLIEGEVDVVGAVEDGQAVIDAADMLKPDVIVLDISMPRLNGVEVARRLRMTLPSAKLIFLTMHGDPAYVAEALRLGASGYVLKNSASSELLEAIHRVVKGQTYLTPLLKAGSGLSRPRKPAEGLTGRQREVLQLMSKGRSSQEVASFLGISVLAVERHKHDAMRKLGLHTEAALTQYAVRNRFAEA